jgi:hypothetical protein
MSLSLSLSLPLTFTPNKTYAKHVECTDTDKALVMVFEILKGLVGGLQVF